MTPLAQSEMFFVISSFGFVILAILGATLIILCIRAISSLTRVLDKIESNVDSIGDATKELIDDVRDNPIFRLLFRSKKKRIYQSKK